MGLFSAVIHLRDIERDRVLPSLDVLLRDAGFERIGAAEVPDGGPHAMADHKEAVAWGPCYFVSPLSGRWLTLIEAHFTMPKAPHLSDLCKQLSSALSCYALALIVHDDDLFLYNLDYKGTPLDGYNSCPQYFEQRRLSEKAVAQQRHSPEPFAELLPTGSTLDELRTLLNRGWWNAHDTGRLDENGVVTSADDGFVFEDERMTAFGSLLQLHGASGEYPYAAWAEDERIEWPLMLAVRYCAT